MGDAGGEGCVLEVLLEVVGKEVGSGLGTARKGSPAEKAVESLLALSVPPCSVCSNPGTKLPASATDRSPESVGQRLFLGSALTTHNH